MLYAEISRVLGKYFVYLAGILLIPLGVSILYEFFLDDTIYFQTPATVAFLETIAICLFCSVLLSWFGRKLPVGSLPRKESILLVVVIWFMTAGVGSLPFIFTKAVNNPLDAYFESMSGLTTTGASILYPKAYDPVTGNEIPITLENPLDPNIVYTFYGTIAPLKNPDTGVICREGLEALGKPLLFWRSFLQWVGGIGIVVLFIAVLPALAMGGKFLYESEATGPTKEGMTPRIKETASFLWKIYLGLTLLQIALLIASNWKMPLFDAITLSFSTISTGGFTIYNNGLAGYHNSNILWIITLFMILGGLNFSLYFHCLKRKVHRLYDHEFFSYLGILFIGSLLMAWTLWGTSKHASMEQFTFTESLAHGSFQAISAQTSTGFFLGNYDYWPMACQILMIVLMYIGGMSGSTAGGIKVVRIIIAFRIITYKIESFFRPGVVRVLKIGNKEIADKTAMTLLTFFCIMLFLVIVGTYILVLDEIDPVTAFGIISTTITNTGLLFGGIGSTASLAFLSTFSKIIAILWMVLGRLEFFSLLVLLVPTFWRSR